MKQTLSQIIAIDSSTKTRAEKAVTAVHHLVQRTEPMTGISRSYQMKDEDGDDLPSESKRVQVTADDAIKQFQSAFGELFDVTATKDFANCHAKSDIVVDGVTLAKDVPATYLLFLEKKLADVHTFIQKLPTLDPAEVWARDEAQNCWASEAVRTTRTKKVPRNHVKAAATDKHPAQVEIYHEDIVVGTWTVRKFSGALPAARVAEFLSRVDKLLNAVKFAREKANTIEAPNQKLAEPLLGYVFGGK